MCTFVSNNFANSKDIVIILPHAGSYAQSLYNVISNIHRYSIIIEYPGRGIVSKKNFCDSFSELQAYCLDIISKFSKHNIILVGISMGAYLAYEITMQLQILLTKSVTKLILLSVQSSNELSSEQFLELYYLNDKELIRKLNYMYNNTIDLKLDHYYLNVIRQDMKIMSTYNDTKTIKINSNITIINGNGDNICNNLNTKNYWKNKTLRDFKYLIEKGGHFFYQEKQNFLFNEVM